MHRYILDDYKKVVSTYLVTGTMDAEGNYTVKATYYNYDGIPVLKIRKQIIDDCYALTPEHHSLISTRLLVGQEPTTEGLIEEYGLVRVSDTPDFWEN